MKIGIDIGGSHMEIGLIDEEYRIINKHERDWTDEEKNELWQILPEVITKEVKTIIEKNNIKELELIGIGFPKANIVNNIVYINEDVSIDLKSVLEAKFKTKVYVRNDVKCSGLCEKRIGSLKKYDNAFFLTLGTGIGGAYFYKNELVVPNKYPGFEIGSMIIEKDGRQCKCGKRGCFEAYSAMKVFRDKIKELLGLEKVNSHIFFEILEKGERKEEINNIVDEYIDYLCIGLSNIINIFEPDAICIGGSFVHYEKIFMDKLKQKLNQEFEGRDIPEILIAKYGNEAGVIGASMIESN